MKKKLKWIVLFSLLLVFLGGWGKKSVELLNDKKLIDLNEALQICMPGADSPDDDINTENEREPENTEIPDNPTDAKDDKKIIVISVRERIVSYGSTEKLEVVKLEERLRKDYKKGMTVRLVDDFAEAHVYKKVIAVLEQLEEETGLKYTRD